jgi:hypothetical protein
MLDGLWSQEDTSSPRKPCGIRTYTLDEMLAIEEAHMKAHGVLDWLRDG